jgi:DNA-binding response OmpR family regulator
MRVLIVEDAVPLREALVQGLQEEGYVVDAAHDGEQGLEFGLQSEYDLIILDLMLPKMSGEELLGRLRGRGSRACVILLTAKGSTEERINGLDAGADDYLTKPFAFAELLSRVRALLRRKYQISDPVITLDDLVVNLNTKNVQRGNEEIRLSAREYALLEYLLLKRGEIVSRAEIVDHVYELKSASNSNVIDVFVAHLRKKIERPERPTLLHTRRGFGYSLGLKAE